MAGSVLECPDDRKNRVVGAQATYQYGSSAVGGRACELGYVAEQVCQNPTWKQLDVSAAIPMPYVGSEVK